MAARQPSATHTRAPSVCADSRYSGGIPPTTTWDWICSTAGGNLPEIVMAKLSENDFVANGAGASLTTRIIATKNPNPHS